MVVLDVASDARVPISVPVGDEVVRDAAPAADDPTEKSGNG